MEPVHQNLGSRRYFQSQSGNAHLKRVNIQRLDANDILEISLFLKATLNC